MRPYLITLAALLVAFPAAGQHGHGGGFPEGWAARVDRDQPVEGVSFMAMDGGYHVMTGPAAVLYNSDWTHSGDYAVSARFTQNTAPAHPEAYGIIVGGSDLDGAGQAYSYFLVRGTGEYFIATRDGDEREIVVPWTAHEAIEAQGDSGRQVNVIGAQVVADEIVFTVNGAEVARRPRSEVRTEGVFGFRVNHRLDVMIDQVSR